jgi:hypothetical protein
MSSAQSADASELGSAFADVPRDARGHLGLMFYAAAFQIIHHLRSRGGEGEQSLDEALREHPFLRSYVAEIRRRLPEGLDREQAPVWLREQILEWEQRVPGVLPLVALREALRLPYAGALAFLLAGLVEEQAEFSVLFASMQSAGRGNHLSFSLLRQVLQDEETPEAWLLARPLIESGFLDVINRDQPRSAWSLRVPAALWNAVRGECAERPLDGVRHHPAESLETLDEMLIAAPLRDRLGELTRLAGAGRVRTVVLRGMLGTDRLGVLGALARGLGRGVMEIDCANPSSANAGDSIPTLAGGADRRFPLIGPLSTLTHTMPVFALEAGPGETFEIPALAGYAGPVAVMMGREGGVLAPDAANAVTLQLDLESPENRAALWRRALDERSSNEVSQTAETLASTFCLPGRYIRRRPPARSRPRRRRLSRRRPSPRTSPRRPSPRRGGTPPFRRHLPARGPSHRLSESEAKGAQFRREQPRAARRATQRAPSLRRRPAKPPPARGRRLARLSPGRPSLRRLEPSSNAPEERRRTPRQRGRCPLRKPREQIRPRPPRAPPTGKLSPTSWRRPKNPTRSLPLSRPSCTTRSTTPSTAT